MSELLLELFSEELPSSMQIIASNQFQSIFTKFLIDQKLNYTELKVLTSPRRIIIYINGLPLIANKEATVIKGPNVKVNNVAIEGFCKSLGIEISNLNKIFYDKLEYYVYQQPASKIEIADIFKNKIPELLLSFSWPKSMHWGHHEISWGRPLRNILCLFNNEIIAFQLGHLTANNVTFTSRSSGAKAISVNSFNEYELILNQHNIVFDHIKRKDLIFQGLKSILPPNTLLHEDPDLLNEVCGLVETPFVMLGNIKQKFLTLPHEVLITSMRNHQKYFSVFDNKGNLAPYFLFVSNINPVEPQHVIEGNEKVLSARLSDALYFYEQDIKISLIERYELLDNLIFHQKIGTLKDKCDRLVKLMQTFAPNNYNLMLAAKICKSDLTTEMVKEFPELQGVMGYYYALNLGVDLDVALIIRDYYKPFGANDIVPTGYAAMLSIFDKLDSLCGLMLAGEKATSSKDPYALRRLAISIIRIILINKIDLDLRNLIELILTHYQTIFPQSSQIIDEVIDFFEERIVYYLKKEFDPKLLTIQVNLTKDTNILRIYNKLVTFSKFILTAEGSALIEISKRVTNILGDFKPNKINDFSFNNEYEENLQATINQLYPVIINLDFTNQLNILVKLKAPIDEFFKHVMVNDLDLKIANQRLNLLYQVKKLIDHVINFEKL